MMVVHPIAMKINVKVGVNNTILARPLPIIDERPTIIFGADVTHHSNKGGLKLFNSRGNFLFLPYHIPNQYFK